MRYGHLRRLIIIDIQLEGMINGREAINMDNEISRTDDRTRRNRMKEPSLAKLEFWVNNGVAQATDGCKVEPDGTCPHGCPSWLIELGYI